MTPLALSLFEENRELLFGISYRMLGTVMDAQDMVQNTFLRWRETSPSEVRSPRAWLTTVVTRLCINHLKSARVQREMYIGPWLPEPIVANYEREHLENTQLADSLSLAFLVLLESLTPAERAVFVLREVFTYEFSEIAGIVEKSETNCRQILARARKAVEERRPRFDASTEDAERLVQRFGQVVRTGDIEGLLDLLAKDVVLVSDGGGKARAVLRPIHGPDHVARLLTGARRRFGSKTQESHCAMINGLPGIISYEGDRPLRVVALGILEGCIHSIFIITNPDKLRHVSRRAHVN